MLCQSLRFSGCLCKHNQKEPVIRACGDELKRCGDKRLYM